MISRRYRYYKYIAIPAIIFFILISIYSIAGRFGYGFNINKEDHLNSDTRDYINKAMDFNPNIVAIQIAEADLRTNTRHIVFTSIRKYELKTLYNNFIDGTITKKVPVFTKDQAANERIIRILNHEFVCSSYKDTISYKFVPESGKYISTVCAMSIPPHYGEFKGIVGFFLEKEPTETEKEFLRSILREISLKVAPELKVD